MSGATSSMSSLRRAWTVEKLPIGVLILPTIHHQDISFTQFAEERSPSCEKS